MDLITRGDFKLSTNNDCPMPSDVLGPSLGNNPAAPYALPLAPLWPPNGWIPP